MVRRKMYGDHDIIGKIDSMNISFEKREILKTNRVYVTGESDMPTPIDTGDGNGVAIHLANGVTYISIQDWSSSYTIVASANYGFGLFASLGVQTYAYTGTGIAFTDSNKKFGSFGLFYMYVTAPSGTLFDFESDDPNFGSYFFMDTIYGFDVDRAGYARANISMDIVFSGIFDCGDGITIDSTQSVYIGTSSWWSGKNRVGSVKLTVLGACDNLVMSGWVFDIQANETAFDIQAGSTINGANISSGVVTGIGTIFKTGSKDQSDPSWVFSGNSGVPDSQTIGSLYMERNATPTVIPVGETGQDATFTSVADGETTGSITVFADYSGTVAGTVKVTTSAIHGLTTGDEVVHSATTNYNGTYIITVIDTTNYYITHSWDGDDATGTWVNYKSTITSATHGLSNGDIVWIVDDDYSGKWTITNVTTNTFDIPVLFTSTTTGVWETYWFKVAGTTFPMENERASMTGNNEITFANLEPQSVVVAVSTNPKNDSIAAAKDWEFAVMKNSQRLKGSLKFRQMTDKAAEGSIACTTTAISGDIFEVYVRNVLDTTDMIMVNMSVVISK